MTKCYILVQYYAVLNEVFQTIDSREIFSPSDYVCSTPIRAKIELFDHNTGFPDSLLLTKEVVKNIGYSLEWEERKIFNLDPYLKFKVECPGGLSFEKEFAIIGHNPFTVMQSYKIDIS
uniref:Uncharacterized protein n=1 Tax=Panagrolaimus superbus TaxID=310955 RepID=A0A914XXZ7_9BILA